MSAGRLTLGVGIGWPREEFAALGVPFARQAARTREYVVAMRTLWREDVASFAGEFVDFEAVRLNPRPHVRRQIPIVVVGNSDAALHRAASWGDGWYGFYLDSVDQVADRLDFLSARCRELAGDPAHLRLAVALREPNEDELPALASLGVDELVIVASPPADPHRVDAWVAALADRWLPTRSHPSDGAGAA